jgi:EAL domain-containing protein (putative c-di-GMP-specific phosphodiesterase class I)
MSIRRLGAAGQADVLTPEVRESTLSWRVGVEYQPLVDVHTHETVAHEALARFRAADGSALAPDRVFPEFRRDLSLLAEVELHLKHLQIERAPGRAVFLNVDADAWHAAPPLTRRALLDRLSRRCHVEIVVEVVESGDERAAARARAMMRELREANVSIALDDVGASGAVFSIDALRGADVVKFDRSFLDRPRARHRARPRRGGPRARRADRARGGGAAGAPPARRGARLRPRAGVPAARPHRGRGAGRALTGTVGDRTSGGSRVAAVRRLC